MVKGHILSNCEQYIFEYHMIFKDFRKLSKCFLEYLIVSRLTGPSLISSIYGGVCTSQNGGDKVHHMATRGSRIRE